MRKLTVTCLIALACGLIISCGHFVDGFNAPDLAEQKTAEIQSSVKTGDELSWKWSETRTGDGQSLNQIQFLDASYGWASSDEGSLYKTVDGGGTWQKVKVEVPSNRYISSFQFVNSSTGWLISNKNSHDTLVLDGYESYVMFTKDGGKSWQTQYSGKALQIWQVRFVSEQEGWTVGRRFVVRDIHEDEVFVLHTADQGKHWVNVSKNFPAGTTIVTDVYATEPSKALMLSDETVISSTNAGRSWQKVAVIQGEPPQTAFLRVGMSSGKRLWVLGGADSREGMWMMFARMENDNSWKKYKAVGAYLRDAVFLSEKEILACGRISVEDKSSPFSGKRDGVILYSLDGGQSWSIVYRNSKVSDVNALAVVDGGEIVAVGNDGLILRFSRAV